MSQLILLRHGQSEWNRKNIFTGWIDIPLSTKGIEEALAAGQKLSHLPITSIYTSTLVRGIMTALLAMSVHASGKVPVVIHPGEGKLEEWSRCYDPETEKGLIPVFKAWELNERMYGELQGRNKQAVLEKYGEAQFKQWRRSYATPPPNGESLEMTAKRTLPYFEKQILPRLAAGECVLVSAHGNSLRSIVMEIENLSEAQVLELEIPTGEPLLYTYAHHQFQRGSL